MVATLAGCARILFSETSAAAVYCASINPECRPPSLVRKAGSPLRCGLTRRSMRRSAMVASAAVAMASTSSARATGRPGKLPAGAALPRPGEDQWFVGCGVDLGLHRPPRVGDPVPRRAVHLGHAAQSVGVLDAVGRPGQAGLRE